MSFGRRARIYRELGRFADSMARKRYRSAAEVAKHLTGEEARTRVSHPTYWGLPGRDRPLGQPVHVGDRRRGPRVVDAEADRHRAFKIKVLRIAQRNSASVLVQRLRTPGLSFAASFQALRSTSS
jgi:hypothetical protein